MDMEVSRRDFLKGAGVGIAATALGALGFGEVEAAHAAAIRRLSSPIPSKPATLVPIARSPAAS
jgi:anaerobic selenocysteine-containing dehydrogenase